jgi:hypothetical protein
MLRALVTGLAILHLGPGFAFALLAFGCEQPPLLPGDLCTRSSLSSFLMLTLLAWVILVLGVLAFKWARRSKSAPPAP